SFLFHHGLMSGLFLFLFLTPLNGEDPKKGPKATSSALLDQPRFSCFISSNRRVSAECANNQLVCYYTRRMPRFKSDFRPTDLIGRGCDVPRNNHADSCQEYTKGLDTFVRCECATSDCNTHFWHGFSTAALHHRKLLRITANATKGDADGVVKYAAWFMSCFTFYAFLMVYYCCANLLKRFRFQKRAVLMRAVLVARGTQLAESVMWNSETKELTIHNFKTSIIKVLDGFIRYRSLGSLPAIDINQMRANWVLGRQELHRHPEWFKRMFGGDRLEKRAGVYHSEMLDTARMGLDAYQHGRMMDIEIENVKKEKRMDRKKPNAISSNTTRPVKSDGDSDSSSRRMIDNPLEKPGFVM
ncbi:hypothetical protein PENTCL1PPCAC_27022, partial [Pristionchus entomophagus]